MRLCWRLRSIPELGVLSDSERQAVIATAGGWWMTVRFLALSGLFAAGLSFGASWLLHRLGVRDPIHAAVVISVFVAGIPVTYQFLMLRTRVQIRLAIMDGFKGERVPVCLRCGHDTRGTPAERCPECNAPLRA